MKFYRMPKKNDGSSINMEKWLEDKPFHEHISCSGMTMVPEWYPQSAIVVAWPHEHTDWNYMLEEVERCYYHLAFEVAIRQALIVVAPDIEKIQQKLEEQLPQKALKNISFFECATNDTWTRDTSFITLTDRNKIQLLDFKFNGWGGKFKASDDNAVNRKMYSAAYLKGDYVNHLDFELEGGSIETNGCGDLLTTSECLLNANRGKERTRDSVTENLKQWLGVSNVLWLDAGYLAGDDTDSHVDTLARLCPNNKIVYVQCNDVLDEHYEALHAMEQQLKEFKNSNGESFDLVALPMVDPIYFDGERLPATYANYLVMNDAVLCPTYGQVKHDSRALELLQKVFPEREIVGVDCRALIKQHGSLHCSTMQFPVGVFKTNNE